MVSGTLNHCPYHAELLFFFLKFLFFPFRFFVSTWSSVAKVMYHQDFVDKRFSYDNGCDLLSYKEIWYVHLCLVCILGAVFKNGTFCVLQIPECFWENIASKTDKKFHKKMWACFGEIFKTFVITILTLLKEYSSMAVNSNYFLLHYLWQRGWDIIMCQLNNQIFFSLNWCLITIWNHLKLLEMVLWSNDLDRRKFHFWKKLGCMGNA